MYRDSDESAYQIKEGLIKEIGTLQKNVKHTVFGVYKNNVIF
ncbi:hypothetical protein C2W64_01986 [Brevibacillus laterosporus]|nr:hypothetical protein C2W64_01986 [Brevibacillus laterosporus]